MHVPGAEETLEEERLSTFLTFPLTCLIAVTTFEAVERREERADSELAEDGALRAFLLGRAAWSFVAMILSLGILSDISFILNLPPTSRCPSHPIV